MLLCKAVSPTPVENWVTQAVGEWAKLYLHKQWVSTCTLLAQNHFSPYTPPPTPPGLLPAPVPRTGKVGDCWCKAMYRL